MSAPPPAPNAAAPASAGQGPPAPWPQNGPMPTSWAEAGSQLPHGRMDAWSVDTDGGLWGGAAPAQQQQQQQQQQQFYQHQQQWQQPPQQQQGQHAPSYYGQGMYSGGRPGGGGGAAGPAPFTGGHGAGWAPGHGAPYRGPIGAAPGGGGGGHGRGSYGPAPPGAAGYYGGGGGGGGWYQQRAPRDVRCYACGNPGHVARDCSAGAAGGGYANGGGGGGGARFAGSGSPGRGPRPGSSGPPQWQRRDGCWLVPLPGSAAEAEHGAACARAAAAGGGPRTVWIMRGLPGSGKSTRAAEIAAEAEQQQQQQEQAAGGEGAAPAPQACAIHSTDSYFVEAGSGQYVFDPLRLSEHHDANFDAFSRSLAAGVGAVIVDNTNIQLWQYERYVAAAWRAGYRVREEVVGAFDAAAAAAYAARCVHGVPLDKILSMAQQWQPGP